MPPAEDSTIPKTDDDRKQIALRLKFGMNNRTNMKDRNTKAFQLRWRDQNKPFYEEKNMEKVCWEILVSSSPFPNFIFFAF